MEKRRKLALRERHVMMQLLNDEEAFARGKDLIVFLYLCIFFVFLILFMHFLVNIWYIAIVSKNYRIKLLNALDLV